MIASTLAWRAGRAGLLYPVAAHDDSHDVEIRHGDLVRIDAGSQLCGVVDLTGSVLGGALAVLVPISARGGQSHQIPLSILPGMGIALVEVD